MVQHKHVNVPVDAPKLIKVPGSKHVKFYVTDRYCRLPYKGFDSSTIGGWKQKCIYSEAFTMELN